MRLATDVIQPHNGGGFFASPGGVVTLAVVSAIAGALALLAVRTIPQVFSLLDDIKELLKPADERKVGLVDRLTHIEGEASILKQRVDSHLEVSARDLEQLRADISSVRQSLERRASC